MANGSAKTTAKPTGPKRPNWFSSLLALRFFSAERKIHEKAIVDPEAEIAEDVEIGPFCVIGPNVVIGDSLGYPGPRQFSIGVSKTHDQSGDSHTGIGFFFDGETLSRPNQPSLDSGGMDLYLVEPGQIFSKSTIQAGCCQPIFPIRNKPAAWLSGWSQRPGGSISSSTTPAPPWSERESKTARLSSGAR